MLSHQSLSAILEHLNPSSAIGVIQQMKTQMSDKTLKPPLKLQRINRKALSVHYALHRSQITCQLPNAKIQTIEWLPKMMQNCL